MFFCEHSRVGVNPCRHASYGNGPKAINFVQDLDEKPVIFATFRQLRS
jgi:hypothetical protein